jgi:hypothetical protein
VVKVQEVPWDILAGLVLDIGRNFEALEMESKILNKLDETSLKRCIDANFKLGVLLRELLEDE